MVKTHLVSQPQGDHLIALATHLFDGLLEGLGIGFGNAFLDRLGGGLDEGLGVAQTQACGLTARAP